MSYAKHYFEKSVIDFRNRLCLRALSVYPSKGYNPNLVFLCITWSGEIISNHSLDIG